MKRARQHWPGKAQRKSDLLVGLSTVMGDSRGKSPCRKNFNEDVTLSCPYAG